MKKAMMVLFLLLLAIYGFGQNIYFSPEPAGLTIVSDEITHRGDPKIIVKCNISEMHKSAVSTPMGYFTRISIPTYQGTNKPGDPWLPMMHHLLEVPFGAKLEVRIISTTVVEYNLEDLGIMYPIMPCQPSYRKDEKEFRFVYNKETYEKDEYSNLPLVEIKEVGVLRYYRIASIQLAPILYNPVQKKLKVYTEIELEISMRESDLQRTAEIKQQYYSPYFEWPRQRLIVPESLRALAPNPNPSPVCYVIVADRMFAPELDSLIEDKIIKGFYVEVAYTDEIGKTKEEIQKYLHNLYKNPTPDRPAPTFILFVGDSEHIPPFKGTTGYFVTDLYYAAVTEDSLPDIYYGRFSARSRDDVLAQVEKTLEYEQYRLPDPNFLTKVVLIAGWDYFHAVEWGYPQINYGEKYYFDGAHGFTEVNKFLSSASHQNEAKIRELVSGGVGFVNYTAHGSSTDWSDPTFTKADIEKMMNNNRYCLLIGNCCLTNKFDVETCFGEAWLRIKGKGAIGYIGGSSYTYWDEDLWWGVGHYAIQHPNEQGLSPDKSQTKDGAYDGAFEKGFFTNAGIIMAGNLAVEDSNSTLKVYYWEVYHLMGDPSLMVYWGIPKTMAVVHPKEVKVGTAKVTVQAEEGAYVGITMNGKLHGAGAIGETGELVLDIKPFTQKGVAAIVVTKKDRVPYSQTMPVVE